MKRDEGHNRDVILDSITDGVFTVDEDWRITSFNHGQNKDVSGVSEEALAILMDYDFPGNVRELENIMEHTYVLCRGAIIEPRHLPPRLREREDSGVRSGAGMTLRALEAVHIADAVRRHGGNRTSAARELGIDPSTLFRKIKALKIELPDQDGRRRRKTGR